MNSNENRIEGYKEQIRDVDQWRLQVILYCFGGKHVCIVNNIDPGATICRVTGFSRAEALQRGLAEAKCRLAQTVFAPPVAKAGNAVVNTPVTLDHIDEVDRAETVQYRVTDFLELPVQTRIELILSGRLSYYSDSGEAIPPDQAVKLLGQAGRKAI
jgi:hypothetical protein